MLDSRPVVVAVWLKVVCSRPGLGRDQARQRVEVGALELRQLAPRLDLRDDLVLVADRREHARVGREAGLAAPLAAQARASRTGSRLSCCGEPIVNSSPASSQISRSSSLDLARATPPRSRPAARCRASRPAAPSGRAPRPAAARPPRAAGAARARSISRLLRLGQRAHRDRLARDAVRALDDRLDALLLEQLVERVLPPRGVDQVGGDHRVVPRFSGMRPSSVERRRRCAADRLPVVGDQRPLPQASSSAARLSARAAPSATGQASAPA